MTNIKENGVASRREKWKECNWNNTNAAIAQFMGVSVQAVRHVRKRDKIPSFYGPGGDYTRPKPYKPLTEGQRRRRGLL